MFCRQCGGSIPDTARFCAKCGAAVTAADRPEPQCAPQAQPGRMRSQHTRTHRLIWILAIVAAFGVGVLAGFFLCSALSEPGHSASAAVWESGDVTVAVNDAGHPYAAFTVTAGASADTLYTVIETVQNGTVLRSPEIQADGRAFFSVTKGEALRVKLFTEFDDFAPVGGAFTAEDGSVFRRGKAAPLAAYLDAGLSNGQYTVFFFDGSVCVGQTTITADFE